MQMGIAFIVLNVIDACLTKEALAMGAIELNPVGMFWSSVITKGFVALVIVVGLCLFKKERLLLPLSLAMVGICFWNFAMCLMLVAHSSLLQPGLLLPGW